MNNTHKATKRHTYRWVYRGRSNYRQPLVTSKMIRGYREGGFYFAYELDGTTKRTFKLLAQAKAFVDRIVSE
jgi:hypothetical protein